MTSGIQLAGYPESCCSHCRSTPVSRGAMPSIEAPGRRRPITRNHAEMGWCSSALSPSIKRLLLQRNPDVGRIAAQRFAEKSGRRHADHRERMALDDKCGPDHRRIAAIADLPGAMAEHRNRRCGRRVVIRRETLGRRTIQRPASKNSFR